jgi:hypothetical protein
MLKAEFFATLQPSAVDLYLNNEKKCLVCKLLPGQHPSQGSFDFYLYFLPSVIFFALFCFGVLPCFAPSLLPFGFALRFCFS